MNYKAREDGWYEVHFEAKDLLSLVRLVGLNEEWRKEEQEKALNKVKEAEELAKSLPLTRPPVNEV